MSNASTRLADRALLRVSGAGARDFLQGLAAYDVSQSDKGYVPLREISTSIQY